MPINPQLLQREPPAQHTRLSAERAVTTYLQYEQHFGPAHALLACHAAFPLVLSPELVNLIHLNFLSTVDVPWVAQQDFLLSPLCTPAGDGLYQVDPLVREVLLVDLARFVPQTNIQLVRLADFLLAYVQHRFWPTSQERIRRVYEWIAWSILDPQRVVADMAGLLRASTGQTGASPATIRRSDQLQVSMMLDVLKAPLSGRVSAEEHQNLLETAQVLAYYWHEQEDPLAQLAGDGVTVTPDELAQKNPLLASVLRRFPTPFQPGGQTAGDKAGADQTPAPPTPPLYGSGPVADKRKLWKPGQTLRVAFLDGPEALQGRVLRSAQQWSNYVNLAFAAGSPDEAEIRISFDPRAGTWSYIGTDALRVPQSQPTMNFGWLHETTPDEEVRRRAPGNFSLAIGLIHSHHNPLANIPFDREKVIKILSGSPNHLTREQIEYSLFRKENPENLIYGPIDIDSLWRPQFPREWLTDDLPASQHTGFSEKDIEFLARLYPPGHFVASQEADEPAGQPADQEEQPPVPGQDAAAEQLRLGLAHLQRGELAEAEEPLQRALSLFRPSGDRRGEADALTALGDLYRQQNRPTEAHSYLEQALAAVGAIEDHDSRANALAALAPHLPQDLLAEALAALGSNLPPQLLAHAVAAGLRTPTQALAMAKLAPDQQQRGQTLAALAPYLPESLLAEALADARTLEDAYARVFALGALSPYLPAEQQHAVLEEALATVKRLRSESRRADALRNLAPHLPVALMAEALAIARTLTSDTRRADVLAALQSTLAARAAQVRQEGVVVGDPDAAQSDPAQVEQAISLHQQALTIARELGNKQSEGAALSDLGSAYSSLGQVEQAISFYQHALAIAQEIGDRLGEGTVLGNLGRAYQSQGQLDDARHAWQQALHIFEEIRAPQAESVRRLLAALPER